VWVKNQFSKDLFGEFPIVGILRGFSSAQVSQIVAAAIRGGLRNLEVTMNTPDACEQIHSALDQSEGRLNIGAGTVLNLDLLSRALDAGASFIVTPTVSSDVINRCVKQGIPVFPGALSPSEVMRAWELGATMVKIFPAEAVGPGYIRAVKAPLSQVKLLPTGGVDLKSFAEFMAAGADGFGIGSPLFDRNRIEAADWAWVENQCRAFRDLYRQKRT
jgi:2-dehydro-3-deoxyphosphogluconate aldolase / (4S)-4-hydroxy-2-oxoglutarate aldolase